MCISCLLFLYVCFLLRGAKKQMEGPHGSWDDSWDNPHQPGDISMKRVLFNVRGADLSAGLPVEQLTA